MLFGIPGKSKYKKMQRLCPVKKKFFFGRHFLKFKYEQSFFCPKFCEFYVKALSSGNVTPNQVEAVRRNIKRTFKKDVFLKINFFFYEHLTKKPIASRMGKGKGKPYLWVSPVCKGKSMFEFKKKSISNLSIKFIRLMLNSLRHKLPIKSKIYKIKY